jgi:FkbM family methyltransferase
MLTNLQLVKPFKRYLRQTWLYPAKVWVERHSPLAVRHYQKSLAFYSQFIKSGDLCFDVGANVGNRTEIFASLGAKTICVEPQESCLNRLHQRFDQDQNVIIIDKAVSDHEGFAELSICEDISAISTLSARWKQDGRFSGDFEWSKTQLVALTTLDELIQAYGLPNFCKIDVEGFEVSVLKGLTKQIPFLSFEFNVELLNEAEDCANHLQTIASAEFNYSIGESMELVFSDWVNSSELFKSLKQSDDELLWGDIYVKLG